MPNNLGGNDMIDKFICNIIYATINEYGNVIESHMVEAEKLGILDEVINGVRNAFPM